MGPCLAGKVLSVPCLVGIDQVRVASCHVVVLAFLDPGSCLVEVLSGPYLVEMGQDHEVQHLEEKVLDLDASFLGLDASYLVADLAFLDPSFLHCV